jgi:hypothetical protein
MTNLLTRAVAVAGLALLLGCYHATIETGATPSNETISKSFASGWIFGLVPPSAVATAAKCPDGVAKVETQLSFVNQLVSFLTIGIYTPMEIKVTCAAKRTASNISPGSDIVVDAAAGAAEIQAAFQRAAQLAVARRHPILVAMPYEQ